MLTHPSMFISYEVATGDLIYKPDIQCWICTWLSTTKIQQWYQCPSNQNNNQSQRPMCCKIILGRIRSVWKKAWTVWQRFLNGCYVCVNIAWYEYNCDWWSPAKPWCTRIHLTLKELVWKTHSGLTYVWCRNWTTTDKVHTQLWGVHTSILCLKTSNNAPNKVLKGSLDLTICFFNRTGAIR